MKGFFDSSVLVPVFYGDHVHHKASLRVYFARHRHLQGVIVAMPVAIGAFAEDTLVFRLAPGVIPVVVGRRKLCFTGQ